MVTADFDALEFVLWCAREGVVEVKGERLTLLTAPMAGFYSTKPGQDNPGRTQMRIAYVETPARMRLVPDLLAGLLKQYLAR
jgi:aspartate aminotransferase